MFIDETDETDKFESSLPFRTPTQCMYINSGAIYVHSATGVLTVRGNKQLYLRGERIDTSPGLRGGRGKKITAWNGRDI